MTCCLLLALFLGLSQGTTLLHLSRKRSTRKLSNKHSFLEQVCAPDDILGRITGVHAMIRYTLDPLALDTVEQYLDINRMKTVYTFGKKDSPHIAIWIDLIDSNYKKVGGHRIVTNGTFTKLVANNIDCVEYRYFGYIGDPDVVAVYAMYDVEVWWFQ